MLHVVACRDLGFNVVMFFRSHCNEPQLQLVPHAGCVIRLDCLEAAAGSAVTITRCQLVVVAVGVCIVFAVVLRMRAPSHRASRRLCQLPHVASLMIIAVSSGLVATRGPRAAPRWYGRYIGCVTFIIGTGDERPKRGRKRGEDVGSPGTELEFAL